MRTSAVIALGTLLMACDYNAEIQDCRVACNASTGCPDGLSCSLSDGFCRSLGVAETCAEILGKFPSCVGIAKTCGPGTSGNCCGTSLVPGGAFFRSYDLASDSMYPSTAYPATLGDFRLDTYEVTVARFRTFVAAGMGTQASPPPADTGARALNGILSQGGWDPRWNTSLTANTAALVGAVKCDASDQSWTDTPGANEDLPMNCITWFEAFAFCAWDGGFLPTEAEWNYAAAGGGEQRAYPWSNPAAALTIDCSYANYNIGEYCVNPPNGDVNPVGSESPKGDGAYGQADLAGNVFEWALDWFASLSSAPCNDCANLSEASLRALRGGGWDNLATDVRTNFRFGRVPSLRHRAVGVRCARSAS